MKQLSQIITLIGDSNAAARAVVAEASIPADGILELIELSFFAIPIETVAAGRYVASAWLSWSNSVDFSSTNTLAVVYAGGVVAGATPVWGQAQAIQRVTPMNFFMRRSTPIYLLMGNANFYSGMTASLHFRPF